MGLLKGIIALAIVLVVGHAQAERWILKNPETITPSMKVIKTIEFGKTKYVVVESVNSLASFNVMAATNSEAALPDLKIGIKTEEGGQSAAPAWHVTRMKYADIPAGLNGKGIVVAVLDTGVTYSHAALTSHIWKNAKEVAGNGIDDDKNGYVDDVYGWNYNAKTADPMDDGNHGTHCAGIIAADEDTASKARGVAPGVQIMSLKIIGGDGQSFLSDAATAIKYAVDNGAHIMSNSWRIYESWSEYYNKEGVALLAEALKYAESKGVIFVAAAGNETVDLSNNPTNPMYPGAMTGHKNLFVVGATSTGDVFADYSNFGKTVVHVAAPGTDIMSTVPWGWEEMSGTSMATPLVAGVLALGLQKGYTPTQAMAKLISTSEANVGMKDMTISGGMINIINYLK